MVLIILLSYKSSSFIIYVQRLMRSDILASAILCGIEDIVKEAKNRFDQWMNENKRIPPNLREVIYLSGKISSNLQIFL